VTGATACGRYQSPNFTYHYSAAFGGFAENDPAGGIETESIYEGCEADGLTPHIKLTRYTSSLPGAFTLRSLAISPKPIETVADVPLAGADAPLPAYTQEVGALAGTGPFTLTEWDHAGGSVTLTRNPECSTRSRAANTEPGRGDAHRRRRSPSRRTCIRPTSLR
jgi:peptide/nickel transport system substrate-binding protein